MKMASKGSPSIIPDTINRHQAAIFPAMAMLAGMQLDLFTALKDGRLTAEELAAALGVKPRRLLALLYALVAADLLLVEDGRFANTAEGKLYLVEGSASYLAASRRVFFADVWQAMLKTAASIRADAPQHKHDFHAMSDEELAVFFRGQHFNAIAAGEYLARTYDFNHFAHILDVATGSGGVAIGACQACPQLTATAVDLSRIVPLTRRFLDDSQVADRIATAAVNLMTAAPGGVHDIIVMRNLVQVLSMADARVVTRNTVQSLRPGGRLFVAGSMLDNTHQSPPDMVGQSLIYINIYDDGMIYTEGEYRALLADSGLADIEISRGCMPGGASLAVGRKPS
jgi:SAM-dependent methyltransferase